LLSLSGLPFLAGFPVRLALFENLVEKSLNVTVLVFVGNLGLFLGTYRLLANLIFSDQQEWAFHEEWPQIILLIAAILILIGIGVFPNLYMSDMANLLLPYQTIIP